MRRKLVLLSFLVGILSFPPVLDADCEHDCYELLVMAGVLNDEAYCYEFEEATGRLVWSDFGGAMGGSPASWDCLDDESEQTVNKWSACPAYCPLTQIPQESATGGVIVGQIGFGCYYCSG